MKLDKRFEERFEDMILFNSILAKCQDDDDYPEYEESIFNQLPILDESIQNAKWILSLMNEELRNAINPKDIESSGMGGITISFYQLPIRSGTIMIGNQAFGMVIVSKDKDDCMKDNMKFTEENILSINKNFKMFNVPVAGPQNVY